MKIVYKVMTKSEWAEASQTGVYTGSSLDHSDGYIHFSNVYQVEETVIRHFLNQGNLVLAAASVERLGEALRFEPARGGDHFPHLYANLKIEDILWAKEFDSSSPEELRKITVE